MTLSKTKGKAETLESDCLTGSWAGSLLDAFDRTKAFRKGFSDGATACVKWAKQKSK